MASFREKKPVYDKLTGVQYFEPDMELLREKLPNNPLCKRQYLKPDKYQKEALWALLDVVSKDDIVLNRRKWAKEQAKNLLGKIAEEAGTLTAKMEQAENLEALEAIFTRIKEITEQVPEDVKATMFKLADSVYAKMKEQLDPEKQKAAELEKLNQELLQVDFDKSKQKDLAAFVRRLGDNLGVVPTDMKKTTIQPILEQYVANLPKVDKGGGEPKTEVPADLDKTNELIDLPYTKDLLECKILFLKASTSETESAANVFIDELRKRVNLIPEALLKEVFGNIDWKNFKIDEEYLTSHKDVKDGLLSEIESLESELEELRDQNSDLEDENEELKDENQELQQENEQLNEDLEAEKKSGTTAPENSKSTKSTPTSSGESSK
nr:hypothetical protein [uncultured Draconibacterium sp.]